MDHNQARELLDKLVQRVERNIIGKREEIVLAVVSMLQGGHILLEDVPGVGKTKLVRTLAACVGGTFGRIQFTSDLLPGDVLGVSMLVDAINHRKAAGSAAQAEKSRTPGPLSPAPEPLGVRLRFLRRRNPIALPFH